MVSSDLIKEARLRARAHPGRAWSAARQEPVGDRALQAGRRRPQPRDARQRDRSLRPRRQRAAGDRRRLQRLADRPDAGDDAEAAVRARDAARAVSRAPGASACRWVTAFVPYEPDRLLEVFERHGVRYVVIGGFAAMLRGSPYDTTDVDVTPERSSSTCDGSPPHSRSSRPRSGSTPSRPPTCPRSSSTRSARPVPDACADDEARQPRHLPGPRRHPGLSGSSPRRHP